MGGCYGSSQEDRWRENQLDRYLDSLEERLCEECGHELDEDGVCRNCKEEDES
jgi:predicted amidophosphoribosyltransferase